MADFEQAVQRILQLEGGRSNHPADRGGLTKYGISQRAYPKLSIDALTEGQAREIYRRDYWQPNFDRIADQSKAGKLLDLCVNLGPKGGVTVLQQALNDEGCAVEVDGQFGPRSLMAVNLMPLREFLRTVRARQVRHYVDLTLKDASQLAFLDGWIRRAVA